MENKKVVTEQNKPVNDHRKAILEQRKAIREKKQRQKVVITVLIVCAMTLTGVVAGFSLGRSAKPKVSDININFQNTNEKKEDTGLSITSVKEDGDWIIVNTSYMTLRYPFAFSDIIEVEAYNDESVSQLRFFSNLDDKRILNYVIYFNSDQGIPCGTLKLNGEIPVSVELKEVPKKLSKEWISTYYAVQETFNDVLKSMEENKNYKVAG